MKQAGERITMLTAYDATFARLLDRAGTDVLLVGDSVGMVVQRIVRAGVPVMGHIGLTPKSVHELGGYGVQGRTEEKAQRLLADAKALEGAGCYSLILEMMPGELSAEISRALTIPVIGIGAGSGCDGQVLVIYDLLGMNPEFSPKFVKRYLDLGVLIRDAVARYNDDVKHGVFPGPEHSFSAEKPPVLQLYSSVK